MDTIHPPAMPLGYTPDSLLITHPFCTNKPNQLIHQSITRTANGLDTECELDTNVDFARHLDDLGELDRFLRCALEVFD